MHQQAEVIEEIAKHLGVTPQDIELHASLAEDLGLGPIEMSDLLSALSKKFSVTFEASEIEGVRTVNDLTVMIEDLSFESF